MEKGLNAKPQKNKQISNVEKIATKSDMGFERVRARQKRPSTAGRGRGWRTEYPRQETVRKKDKDGTPFTNSKYKMINGAGKSFNGKRKSCGTTKRKNEAIAI